MTVGLTIECRGGLMAYRESDQFIVLGARESHVHGEGIDSNTQSAKETLC